jgi:regulator of replication initiation timing
MDTLQTVIQNEFTWGLLLGILVAGFIWKAGFTARRGLSAQIKSLEAELKTLQSHLNTQLKITASGNESLQTELDSLRKQNETLRVNQAALQQKPGRAELRMLQVQEIAIRAMREQAPGFAPAWEKAIRQGEQEVDAAESGFTKLIRRVIPSLGASTTSQSTLISPDDQGAQSK